MIINLFFHPYLIYFIQYFLVLFLINFFTNLFLDQLDLSIMCWAKGFLLKTVWNMFILDLCAPWRNELPIPWILMKPAHVYRLLGGYHRWCSCALWWIEFSYRPKLSLDWMTETTSKWHQIHEYFERNKDILLLFSLSSM